MCPEEGCTMGYHDRSSLIQHRNATHKNLRFPCPQAEEYDCRKTYSSKKEAKTHANWHSGIKFPCPLAEQYQCDSLFSFKGAARTHAATHTHPYICPRKACWKRFQSFNDAMRHADAINHPARKLFICPVLTCRSGMAGKRFTAYEMGRHRRTHTGLSGTEAVDFTPQPAEEIPLHSELLLYTLIFQHEGLELTDKVQAENLAQDTRINEMETDLDEPGLDEPDLDEPDLDESDLDESEFEDDYDLSEGVTGVQGYLPLVQNKLREMESSVFAPEHRQQVHQRNITFWESNKHFKVRLKNLGLTCIGPGSPQTNLGGCPKGVTIDFDTARLILQRNLSGSPTLLSPVDMLHAMSITN
ncbi:hypothetical protein CC79DRAFT_1014859 [Sarocladium strictum]